MDWKIDFEEVLREARAIREKLEMNEPDIELDEGEGYPGLAIRCFGPDSIAAREDGGEDET